MWGCDASWVIFFCTASAYWVIICAVVLHVYCIISTLLTWDNWQSCTVGNPQWNHTTAACFAESHHNGPVFTCIEGMSASMAPCTPRPLPSVVRLDHVRQICILVALWRLLTHSFGVVLWWGHSAWDSCTQKCTWLGPLLYLICTRFVSLLSCFQNYHTLHCCKRLSPSPKCEG